MGEPRTDLILDPDRLEGVPVYKLLEAAARGFIAVDHRFLHAILDKPERAIPDLLRFAAEDRSSDPVVLENELVDVFRVLRTPEAIPFLIDQVRRFPMDVDDDQVESFAALGGEAVEPLLALLKEVREEDSDDVAFLLATLGVRDPRILEALSKRLETSPRDAAWSLDVYGDPAALPALEAALSKIPADQVDHRHIQDVIETLSKGVVRPDAPLPPFDIWPHYPQKDSPAFDVLAEAELLAMLDSDSANVRAAVAGYFASVHASDKVRARLIELAKQDPDLTVRGACWEALQDASDEPSMRETMIAILQDANASPEEKGGVAIALAQHTDNRVVFQTIEQLYADPRSRAKALKAMSRSYDRRFAAYAPRHLADPDPEIKRQAIWCVGNLNLASEAPRLAAFFDDEEFRRDALFAYALSIPGETSRGRIRGLSDKVEDAAGGFRADEEELVEIALDQRLILHGMQPVFSVSEPEDEEPEEVPQGKVGRNDPCPCGSGKKYKKCCGA